MRPRDQQNMQQMVKGEGSGDPFVPPEAVAAADEQQPDNGGVASPPAGDPPKQKLSLNQRFKNLSKKQKILITVLASLVAAGIVVGAYFLFFAPSAPAPVAIIKKQEPKPPPKPTTVASNLTGLQVDPSVNERPVTAIMIENSVDARPQSGLTQAGVVFEAIAEGGITRFVTLWQDTESDYIGPVRSVRPYYLTWLLGFDAAIAHAGGSTEALSLINQWHVKDLNHSSAYFWRVNSRAAPHNLYTSIAKLREYEAQKGYGKAVFTPLARKDKETPSASPTAKTINLNVSSANFNVHYDYDATTNIYKRSEGGAAHTDDKSGAQISPKVVVALVVPQGKNGVYYTYQTVGSGQVFIFQDGIVATGTWKKDSNSANLVFTDANGVELKLNPGQTWFTALGSASQVTYAP